ncbi:MAG: hypothetical protein FJ214_10610 [Ignavibacteria bacterium]|nr:hypothetical protein [Ignavibacteria bacterium]
MRLPKFINYRNPQFSRCPACKNPSVLHRSRPKSMFEQIVKQITVFKIYRCSDCGWRGFISTIIFNKESLKAVVLYLGMILITAYIIRYVLNRFVV